MASKLKDKDERATETDSGAEAHARQMIEFRRRAELMEHGKVIGREHELLREDRAR